MDEKRLKLLATGFEFSTNPLVQEMVTEIRRCWVEIEKLNVKPKPKKSTTKTRTESVGRTARLPRPAEKKND